MTVHSPVLDAAAQLREALEETAEALATADHERLLRGELGLQLALDRLSSPMARQGDPAVRAALRLEVDRARETLLRCRQLGDMLLDVVRMSLDAQGATLEYGRRDSASAPQPPRVRARG